MKKLLLILLSVTLFLVSCGGGGSDELIPIDTIYTYVPDNNFEVALIGLGLDNTLNDTVLTVAIDTITYLNIASENISDLTGIENFTALTQLYCGDNQLTSLDVSNNTALTQLNCVGNHQLTSLDVSNNTALTQLSCGLTKLTSLDVSNNTALTYLNCSDNKLTSLDLRNGNNTNLLLRAHWNSYLYCIDVDNVTWSNSSNWSISSHSFYSEDCGVK